jgi:glycosyltransferase involved in cell wall biosynthesis
MANSVLISIITINYNDVKGLEQTIKSVLSQTFLDFEYIIIDGASTDGSKKLVEQYKNKLAYWVSESDTGIYNAMNKGIKAAKGDFLLFLNSGDSLCANNILQLVGSKISNRYSIYYGDVIRYYNNQDPVMKTYPKTLSFSFFIDSALAHQTTFIKRELFNRYFFYNETFKILSDWEFIVYVICKENEPYKHLELTIANYDMNGISSKPEGRKIMVLERALTYKKYFPLFINDYKREIKQAQVNVSSQPNRLKCAYNFFKKGIKVLIKG